jgi:pyruvate ferredoxin oxidoreductase gamma subunit
MSQLTEIRWHGRGGQGTVTAAKLFAETAISRGLHVQAFPEYGPERMGAPLRAFNRVSDSAITIHCQVTNPKFVIVVDPTLIKAVNIAEGTDENAIFIINTNEEPEAIRSQLGFTTQQVYCVAATKISQEQLGRPMPNTPLLGAVAKVSGLIDLDGLIDDVKKSFEKKFSSKIVDANIEAIKQAYREVKG